MCGLRLPTSKWTKSMGQSPSWEANSRSVKKFPALHVTQRFTIVFKRTHIPSHRHNPYSFIYLRSVLVSSSRLSHGSHVVSSFLFTHSKNNYSTFQYVPPISSSLITSHTGDEYELWNSPLCNVCTLPLANVLSLTFTDCPQQLLLTHPRARTFISGERPGFTLSQNNGLNYSLYFNIYPFNQETEYQAIVKRIVSSISRI